MNIGKLYLGKGWIGLIAIAIVLVLGLTACGGVTQTFLGGYKTYDKHYTIDNKNVRCIILQTTKGTASLSCDWDHPLP